MLELGKKIQSEVQEEIGKTQREYYLREQLKAIQKELGEGDESEAEIEELRAEDRRGRACRRRRARRRGASSTGSPSCRRPRPSTASSRRTWTG